MAALRSCFFSPSLFAPSSSTKQLIATPANILPAGSRREHRLAVQAQNRDDGHAEPLHGQSTAGNYLEDEMERVAQQHRDILADDNGFLYVEANSMSASVSLSASKALAMASRVMASADLLNLDVPSKISAETARLTVRPYAAVFSATAEDSYYKTVDKNTVVSFLGALTGLAAVSHIMLEDALETIAHMSASDGVSVYAFNADVEAMYLQFKQQMSDLEGEMARATEITDECRLVVPTIRAGTRAAQSIMGLLIYRRNRALKKAATKSIV